MRTHINLTIIILATISITALIWQTLPLVHYYILDDFLIISQNFFVKCSSENCNSILIPLFGYLLNLNTQYESFLALNIGLACIAFGGYIFITQRFENTKNLPYLELYTLLSIGFFIRIEVLTPPDIITILLAISGLKLYFIRNKYSYYLLLAPLLISFAEWALEYIILMIILIFNANLKIQKRLLISLATAVIAGVLISQMYLFLIEYHNNWMIFASPAIKEKAMHSDFWTFALLISSIISMYMFCTSIKIRHTSTLLVIGINIITLILCNQLPYALRIIPIILITTTNFVLLNAQYTKRKFSTPESISWNPPAKF